MKKNVIFWVVLGNAAVGAVFLWFIIQFQIQENLVSRLQPHVEEYMKLEVSQSKQRPYIRGKILPVNIDRKSVDTWLFSKLPARLLADDPGEIGTVVWVSWSRGKVSDHENPEKRQITLSRATVTIIDIHTKEILDVKVFHGEENINSENPESSFQRDWPVDKVVEYIVNLPSKN